jgi:hypothetical protein
MLDAIDDLLVGWKGRVDEYDEAVLGRAGQDIGSRHERANVTCLGMR